MALFRSPKTLLCIRVRVSGNTLSVNVFSSKCSRSGRIFTTCNALQCHL